MTLVEITNCWSTIGESFRTGNCSLSRKISFLSWPAGRFVFPPSRVLKLVKGSKLWWVRLFDTKDFCWLRFKLAVFCITKLNFRHFPTASLQNCTPSHLHSMIRIFRWSIHSFSSLSGIHGTSKCAQVNSLLRRLGWLDKISYRCRYQFDTFLANIGTLPRLHPGKQWSVMRTDLHIRAFWALKKLECNHLPKTTGVGCCDWKFCSMFLAELAINTTRTNGCEGSGKPKDLYRWLRFKRATDGSHVRDKQYQNRPRTLWYIIGLLLNKHFCDPIFSHKATTKSLLCR